eukprot:scaffold5688_cov104-Cylindrotheca_fusiformis.AAC.11
MSDLLPLVVDALKDKTAIDAQAEIAQLRRQLEQFFAVEIIRGEREDGDCYGGTDDQVTVYAAGSYDKGAPALNNRNLWEVKLQSVAACKLADLGSCCLCAGGGFTIASFANSNPEGWLDEEDDDGTENRIISFSFEPTTWLTLSIKGWPRRNWERVMRENSLDPYETLSYLVEDVARSFPDATVEFRSASFVSGNVHAVFQRMLPPERRAEARRICPPGTRASYQRAHDLSFEMAVDMAMWHERHMGRGGDY